ncbi:MAG: hypothetical protein GTO63_18335 [Anaerolineae bacterium]|nr:hypothetical protein [Anaerolineae bacterium]NIN96729.1 hypothetical protein [Anaerolineae bacterium]
MAEETALSTGQELALDAELKLDIRRAAELLLEDPFTVKASTVIGGLRVLQMTEERLDQLWSEADEQSKFDRDDANRTATALVRAYSPSYTKPSTRRSLAVWERLRASRHHGSAGSRLARGENDSSR